MRTTIKLFLMFLMFSTCLWADGSFSSWYTQDKNKHIIIHVELFLSSTCSHCHKIDVFFNELKANDLHIQPYFIDQDKNALIRFNQLLNDQHMDDFSVPSVYFCGSRWVGFASNETTGKDLLHAIHYCKQQIEQQGTLTQATVNTLRHWANANKFDSGMIENPSIWSYLTILALTDAFSPCALFGFSGFLAVLLIANQKRRQIIASLLFIASVALTHYFQQAHAGSYFALLPWLRLPAALLGLMTVYFLILCYKKQFNTYLYFILAFFLGIMIMLYQQTCVMSWSAVFQQGLMNRSISNGQASIYQLLYQGIYVLPLILILIVYLFLFKIQRAAALNTGLNTVGFLFMGMIALCFIIYPFVLSYFTLSALSVLILFVCGYFLDLILHR